MDLDQRTGEDPQGRPVAAAAPLQDAGAGGAAPAAAASAPGAVLPAGSSGGQDEGDASRTLAPAAPLGAPEPAVRRGPWTDRREVTGWDGTFEEAAALPGVSAAGYGRAAGFADYDGDGALDLYVANDGSANALFRNRFRVAGGRGLFVRPVDAGGRVRDIMKAG